ncbi:MAG: type II secretion system F family protein, partial [Oscillospiraceae bacterium]|nr:type II secretion system F family protein [Oscillospiraceae bacterium]
FLQGYWYTVIIAVLVLTAAYRRLQAMPESALFIDKTKLKLAVAGKLLKIIYTARFARTLSSLYASGVSMITALEVSAAVVGNKFIESQFAEVIRNVRNGEPLSVAIAAVDGFDSKLSATIMIGEESGRLDTMLVSTAESFDYEAEAATGRLVSLIEPVMIIFLAVIIGAIMLSVMLPVMSLYENVGNM